MEHDEDRAREKTAELTALAANAITNHWRAVGLKSTDAEVNSAAEAIVDAFVRVTPPEKEPVTIGLIVMSMGGRQGGRSRKPGNLMLNMRALVTTVSKAALSAKAVAAAPWTAPLAALVIWDSVSAGMSVDLSERDATVM